MTTLRSIAGIAVAGAVMLSHAIHAAQLRPAPVSKPAVRVINPDAYFPEGPMWYAGKLYYVEYGRNAVMTWDGKNNQIFSSEQGCGESAVATTGRGEFLTTCYDNGSIGRMTQDGVALPSYTHDKDGNAFQGPNDLVVDTHGGVYFTASGHHGPIVDGEVFYIAPDATISRVARDLHNANGITIAADGHSLLVVETEDNRILQFSIANDGTLSGRRVFANLDELTGHVTHIWPDGIKTSKSGELYVGQSPRDIHAPLAGQIFVLDSSGRLLRSMVLPSPKVPNLALSPDEKSLYVMAVDQIDAAPYHGKVYVIENR